MKGALKKIIYNCKQATFLIEKKTLTEITASEALQLKIHLAGCSVCRTFEQQSLLINHLFTKYKPEELQLDEDFKKDLQQKIEKKIDKN
ncbi:hypothetical protein [Pedobacter endophyticus]|uniref:Zinc-finger n=1 Tax=Pedobacter endophyticus TaxID=2789740 RepID=A0A7S9KZ70_9SPHI|nr:hypothetical protein [Pedobacter endophyticus]QPH39553.1 hypothetical protein IZT61_21355 [Pedobacter endophyticus]